MDGWQTFGYCSHPYEGDVIVKEFRPIDDPDVWVDLWEDDEGRPIPDEYVWLCSTGGENGLVPYDEYKNTYYTRYEWYEIDDSFHRHCGTYGKYCADGFVYPTEEAALNAKWSGDGAI